MLYLMTYDNYFAGKRIYQYGTLNFFAQMLAERVVAFGRDNNELRVIDVMPIEFSVKNLKKCLTHERIVSII